MDRLQLATERSNQEKSPLFEKTIEFTVLWYKQYYSSERKKSISDLTLDQINEYCNLAKIKDLKWTI